MAIPPLLAFVMIVAPLSQSLYYGAIISGLWKDPLMAHFRDYGAEHRVYPLCRFLEWTGLAAISGGLFSGDALAPYSYIGATFAPLAFFVVAILAFIGDFIVRRHPDLREALPRWYFELLRNATRQERRFIGFAWLRIPRRMRWRLNGDQAAFRTWADTVRITVIYGAYDPNNPWTMWG